MPAPYFFFRPLLAQNRSWAAFDWQISDSDLLEGAELTHCFAESGAATLADAAPLLIPARLAWLEQSEFIQNFAPHQAIFILPAAALDDPEASRICRQLRKQGRHCALRINAAEAIRRIPAAAFDYLVFDADAARHDIPLIDLLHATQAGLKCIASGVSSRALFDWLAARHFELCDGRFVALSDPAATEERDLTRLKLLKLLNLVAQDADTREIEAVFREEPKLSYNLLRLVNSVAIGARSPIGSFSQAITVLGRRQLQRWLQLLIYANQLPASREANPLMLLAAARGRQMELLSTAIDPQPDIPELCDAAFMTGVFSLLDVLLRMSMAEILDQLPLQKAIADALSTRRGVLGELLDAVDIGESAGSIGATPPGDLSRPANAFARFGISPAHHAISQTAAFHWASRINFE